MSNEHDTDEADEFADAVLAFYEAGDMSAEALDRLTEELERIEGREHA